MGFNNVQEISLLGKKKLLASEEGLCFRNVVYRLLFNLMCWILITTYCILVGTVQTC